jgi:hypothetical protein
MEGASLAHRLAADKFRKRERKHECKVCGDTLTSLQNLKSASSTNYPRIYGSNMCRPYEFSFTNKTVPVRLLLEQLQAWEVAQSTHQEEPRVSRQEVKAISIERDIHQTVLWFTEERRKRETFNSIRAKRTHFACQILSHRNFFLKKNI